MTTNQIIQKATFEMFRDWSKIASEMYPNMDFSIIDETKLVEDIKKTIAAALRCLFASEYNEERKNQYWCIGFIRGFIQSNLGVKWSYDYYQKQTDNYQSSIDIPNRDYFSREEILSFITN